VVNLKAVRIAPINSEINSENLPRLKPQYSLIIHQGIDKGILFYKLLDILENIAYIVYISSKGLRHDTGYSALYQENGG
jgi:hypothetical protein